MKNQTRYAKATKAMKAAHTNWKAGRYTEWSKCLKSAWAWVKRTATQQPIKQTTTVFASENYRETEKAMMVNSMWFPKSQITENWTEFKTKSGEIGAYLESIEVPNWLYGKKMQELNY